MRLAARGARETEKGTVTSIEDPEEAKLLKRQAARVYRESVAIALLVTGVSLLARSVAGS